MKYTLEELKRKNFVELKQIGDDLNLVPEGDRRFGQTWIDAIAGVPPLLALLEVSPAGEVQAQEPIAPAVKTKKRTQKLIEVQAQEPLKSKFGRIIYPKPAAKPIAQNEEARPQLDRVQSADAHNLGSHSTKSDRDSSGAKTETLGSQEGDRVLAVAGTHQTERGRVLPDQSTKLVNQAVKASPGVKVDYAEDILPNCVVCFGDKFIEDASGCILNCAYCTEARVSKSAIVLGTENSPGVKLDQNPILTGIALSDRFLATYPPYFGEVHYKAEASGQLNLLKPVTDDEPPDPDDFESLDAFHEAIARWDWEHPSSFDYFSDLLPNSVQNEPSSVQNELPLQVSLDSFSLWAHCP